MADRIKRSEVSSDEPARRLQEIVPGEYADEFYVVNAQTAAVAQQRLFLGGSGKLTLTVAGNIRGLFANPTGSGRKVHLVRLAALTTVTAFLDLRRNPTTGLPTASRAPFNAVLGGPTGQATLVADTDTTTALGGGTLLSTTLGLPANSRTSIDLPPLVLAPGQSLGLNINLASGADAVFSLYWIEEDL